MEKHVPVLREEVLSQLAIRPDGLYVDATFGRGGHSRGILAQLGPAGRLLALDRDPDAVKAGAALATEDPRFTIHHERFGRLREFAAEAGIERVHGILLDIGVSSPQLDEAERGFSFSQDGPLDMRMDPGAGQGAAEWLNAADKKDIARVLRRLGEEPAAGRIAAAIVRRRKERAITTTAELAAVIEGVVPRRPGGRHPATRSFQAIRMHVNRELEELEQALHAALDLLAAGGRLCVITFHSLEDRMVKRFLRDHSRVDPALARLPVVPDSARPRLCLPTQALRANDAELAANPRARSATLRVGECL